MIFELSQYSDVAFLILRLVIAAIFIYHALPKLKNASGLDFRTKRSLPVKAYTTALPATDRSITARQSQWPVAETLL